MGEAAGIRRAKLPSMSRVRAAVIALVATMAAPASAQSVIGSYRAYIGAADLVNSRGVRLSHPWQVIRQDRANVHRFAVRQPGDEGDPWFGSGEMRGALETWVRLGGVTPALGARIMAGDVALRVEVLGQGGRATGVRIGPDGAFGGAGGAGPGVGAGPVISPE